MWLASSGADRTVETWDGVSGQHVLTLKGHTSDVGCVAFSADGSRIVSGGDDHSIKLWETTSGHELLTLNGHAAEIECVAFSADGESLISASIDGAVKVWNATPSASPAEEFRLIYELNLLEATRRAKELNDRLRAKYE